MTVPYWLADPFAVLNGLPLPAELAIGGMIGLLVGSYLATILVRWPQGLSANHGRSRCDGCKRRLSWYELVPLVGYLRAGGRCWTCQSRISPFHPLIEAGCGLLGCWFFALHAPLLAPLSWLLLLLAFFDARLFWLPDALVLPLALVALAVPSWRGDASLAVRITAGIIGFATLWSIAAIYLRVTRREGLGGGDPKLFGAIGLWLGAYDLPLLMVVACIVGLIDATLRWPRGASRHEVHLPLGAYLCVAALGFALVQPLSLNVG